MEKDVIILCLPPHSSQDTQLLDVGVYGPLKQHWSREYHGWMASNPHKLMGKVHFTAVSSKVWSKAVTSSNVVWLDLGKQLYIPLMTKSSPYQLMVKLPVIITLKTALGNLARS